MGYFISGLGIGGWAVGLIVGEPLICLSGALALIASAIYRLAETRGAA